MLFVFLKLLMSSNDDDEEELSRNDGDDGFEDDLEALSKACLLTGTNLYDLKKSSSSSSPTSSVITGEAAAITTTIGSDSDADNAEDDLELVHNMQKSFAIVTDDLLEPLMLKPLCSIPPTAEEEDDFETLCAIQRRFSAYSRGVDGKNGPFSSVVTQTTLRWQWY